METNISITCKDDFRTWQHKTRELFQAAKEEELLLIGEEYKDVLADYESAEAASQRVIGEFEALLSRQPKKSFSWDGDEEIMEAHAVAMGEITRIKVGFQTKWGDRYQEYLNVMEALEKEIKKAIAKTRSYANYQTAMRNLALRNTEGGE